MGQKTTEIQCNFMAQPSKKDQIAAAALPLILQHGIKGTSIDSVVKTSGVSKPTVYNHFPDKSALVEHVVCFWLADQPPPAIGSIAPESLLSELSTTWLQPTALRFYGLFMGEGERAPAARAQFQQEYDQAWRASLASWCQRQQQDEVRCQQQVSHELVRLLLAYPLSA